MGSRIIEADATDLPKHCKNADLVFADPPYNRGFDYGTGPSDDLHPAVYLGHLGTWIESARDATRPGGMVALLISEEWADDAGSLMTKIIGPRWNRIIWHEKFAQYTDRNFTKAHRHLFLHRRPSFKGEREIWNTDKIRVPSARMKAGDKRAAGPRVPDNVWNVRRLQGNSNDRVPGHPCQLAPEPLTWLVDAFTDSGGLVGEQFAGVGSLTRVAVRMGRRYTGVELNPEYVSLGNQRIGIDNAN